MRNSGHVVVIGAAGIDIKGQSYAAPLPLVSNPANIQHSFGGVGRNIAENLARLDIPVRLLTLVGDDLFGQALYAHAQSLGIDMAYSARLASHPTGCYMAMLDNEGQPSLALCDQAIIEGLDRDYILANRAAFTGARLIVTDLNISPEALETTFELAARANIPVAVEPTSATKAHKLLPWLDQVYLLTPNAGEAEVLGRFPDPVDDRASALHAAHYFITCGVKITAISLGEKGLTYADTAGRGSIPAMLGPIVDTNGAGDALTAGIIFGLLNDIPVDDAMRLGVTAATLTLQTMHSVSPNLTTEKLYESLVI
ncbi:MAG: carbohydrate kinase family protein [Anaerolineales bacterium]